jgi:hypothetical protein
LWSFVGFSLGVWKKIRYFSKWFIVPFNFIHKNVQWPIFILKQLFHFFPTITIFLLKLMEKKRNLTISKTLHKKKHFEGYKTNGMQGKRQIINSSFLSSLWHKIVKYLEWKIKNKKILSSCKICTT